MNATQQLHSLGQSLWLDNITRALLANGTLQRYIREYSVTGLTSKPTIFDKALKEGDSYDAAIRQKTTEGKSGEALFFELALEDLTQAADLFRPIHDLAECVYGWVSLEVSPLLANDATETVDAVAQLHRRARRPNLFIKIPGTPAGVPGILINRLGRRARRCSCATASTVSVASFASNGETSSDTQPSTPSVRSWIGRKRSAAWVKSSSASSKNSASPDLPSVVFCRM